MLLKFVIVLAAALALAAARPSRSLQRASLNLPRGPTSHIVGGETASLGQWPSQLTMEYRGSLDWTHECGAVLINTHYALTCAHCVDGIPYSDLRFKGGLIWRNDTSPDNGQLLIVASVLKHPDYNGFEAGVPNDLAIVTFLSPADVSGPNLKNAILPPDDTNRFNHKACWVSGFGRVDDNYRYSQSLQYRQMDSIENDECAQRFSGVFRAEVLPTHLCVTAEPAADGPCNGDSGSPLHCHPSETDTTVLYQVSIMSWNAAVGGQCNLAFPTVSTRLSKYLDWLNTNTP